MLKYLIRWARLGCVTVSVIAAGWAQQNTMFQIPPMPDPGRNLLPDLGPNITRPSVKKRVKPEYPPEAAALGIKGVVEVGLDVNANGNARNLRVIRSDSPMLNQAALDAVAKWTFRPGRVSARAMTLHLETKVKFSLSRQEQRDALARLPLKSQPRPVLRVAPKYPKDAELVALSGEVMVEFVVTETGAVQDARVVKTSHEVFNQEALNAIAQWAFIPAIGEGKTQATRLRLPFVFNQPSHLQFLARLRAEVDAPTVPQPRHVVSVEKISPERPAVVYPFLELLENRQGVVTAELSADPTGRHIMVQWQNDPPPAFQLAIEAMLDMVQQTARSTSNPDKLHPFKLRLEFNPYDGDVSITDAAAAILKRLRIEGNATVFPGEAELDTKLEVVKSIDPVFPSRLPSEIIQGQAEVEFFVDETGRVQLPRMVTSTDPAFGYAACQAVASWRYEPLLLNGKPTIVRAQQTLFFKR
jgi:TonB family protein